MFEMYRLFFLMYSGQETFLSIMEKEYSAGSSAYALIVRAYELVKKEFEGNYRESGEMYLRHLEGTALIVFLVLKTLKIDNVAVIVAALLHDILEDIPLWTYKRLAQVFGQTIADLVKWVTKPNLGVCGGSEILQEKQFKLQLAKAPFLAIVIKLADQLNNLMTLWAKSVSSQRKKIKMAREFYLPLAKANGVLVHEYYIVIARAELLLAVKSMSAFVLLPRMR